MIEKFEELELEQLEKIEDIEELSKKLDEICLAKLGIGLFSMKSALRECLIKRAQELALGMQSLAPHGNFEKLIENEDEMTQFMQIDACQENNWRIKMINEDPKFKKLLRFEFLNQAVDEGNVVLGVVFVSKSGVIRHALVEKDEL